MNTREGVELQSNKSNYDKRCDVHYPQSIHQTDLMLLYKVFCLVQRERGTAVHTVLFPIWVPSFLSHDQKYKRHTCSRAGQFLEPHMPNRMIGSGLSKTAPLAHARLPPEVWHLTQPQETRGSLSAVCKGRHSGWVPQSCFLFVQSPAHPGMLSHTLWGGQGSWKGL